jgi:hypothetical protein
MCSITAGMESGIAYRPSRCPGCVERQVHLRILPRQADEDKEERRTRGLRCRRTFRSTSKAAGGKTCARSSLEYASPRSTGTSRVRSSDGQGRRRRAPTARDARRVVPHASLQRCNRRSVYSAVRRRTGRSESKRALRKQTHRMERLRCTRSMDPASASYPLDTAGSPCFRTLKSAGRRPWLRSPRARAGVQTGRRR